MPTRKRRRNSQHCGGSEKTATTVTTTTHNQPTNQPAAKLSKPKPKPHKDTLQTGLDAVGVPVWLRNEALGVLGKRSASSRRRSSETRALKLTQSQARATQRAQDDAANVAKAVEKKKLIENQNNNSWGRRAGMQLVAGTKIAARVVGAVVVANAAHEIVAMTRAATTK